MRNDAVGKPALDRLRAKSGRFRVASSAWRFFVQLVRVSAPGLVAALAAAFLSKLLWPSLLWTLTVVPIWLLGVTVYLMRRPSLWRVPGWKADALADLESGNTGLFMALEEADGTDWAAEVSGADADVRCRPPLLAMAGAGLLCAALVGVALLPDLRPEAKKRGSPAPVKELAKLVDALAANQLVETQYLHQTQDLIKKLETQEAGGMRADDWHALDQCKEELKQRAMDSLQKFDAARQAAGQLAEELQKQGALDQQGLQRLADTLKKVDSEQFKQSLEQKRSLQRLTKEQEERLQKLADEMSPDKLKDLLDKCQNGQGEFSKAQLEALKGLLQELKGELGEQGEKCVKALIEAGMDEGDLAGLGLCEGSGDGGEEGGLGFVDSDSGASSYDEVDGGLPGKGGVTRGPGAAPLEHIGKTSEKFGEFKAETFQGRKGDLDVDLGYSVAPPDRTDVKTTAGGGPGPLREFRAGDERLTWNSRLLPRHNEVLKQYFESKESGDKK